MTRRKRKPNPQQVGFVQQHLPGKQGGGKATPQPQTQAKGPTPVTPPTTPQPQVITWQPTSKALTYGDALTTASHLNATALGGAVASYSDADSKPVNAGLVLVAGTHVISASTAATTTHLASSAPVAQSFQVRKAAPQLQWKTPAAVTLAGTPPAFTLSKTQLGATVTKGESALVYTPAQGTKLAAGTHFLRAVHAESANYLKGETSVRLLVYANVKEQAGFETVRQGNGWKQGTGLPPAVKQRWDNDTDGVKSKGQDYMARMQDMTPDEMKDFLDKEVKDKSTDYLYQGGNYPNQVWKFANGLQVRVKPNGDAFSSEPKFCIEILAEGKRQAGQFSTSQQDILCKLSIDGAPAPKGPGDTNLGNGTNAEKNSYKTGSCQATHPVCRTKLDARLAWTAPQPIKVGEALGSTQLNATITEGTGTITYAPAAGQKYTKPGTYTLQATLAASKRYKAAQACVQIQVQAVPPVATKKTVAVKKTAPINPSKKPK
jgi:hypothetical protein